MKKTTIIFSVLVSSFAFAAVPVKWIVETSQLQPATFDVVRGESLSIEANFMSYGSQLNMGRYPCSIFWQTNGMGSAWWIAPATVSKQTGTSVSNVVTAVFTPEMDPGTKTVNGFIGSTGEIYRAAFTLRFRNGPGASPNSIQLPTPTIDCAKVTFLHPEAAPFSGGGASGGTSTNVVCNLITNNVAPWAMAGQIKPKTDLTPSTNYTDTCCSTLAVAATNYTDAATNALPSWTKSANKPTYTATEVGARSDDWMPSAADVGALATNPRDNNSICWDGTGQILSIEADNLSLSKPGTYIKFIGTGLTIGETYDSFWNMVKGVWSEPDKSDFSELIPDGTPIATIGNITSATSTLATKSAVESVSNTVSEWETYWRGDRVRLSVTNYYGNTSGELPRLRIEEFDHSTTTVVDNVQIISNFFHTVWDENDRHTNYMATTDAKVNAISNTVMDAAWRQTNLQLINKAPRAWQTVTSAGEDAPPNTVWHTAPKTVFAGGTEYAHVAVGEGTICVLTDKGAPVYTDGAEGQFRFQDQSGENFFGFDVRSAYKIGCRTDGISVNQQTHIVSLTYDLTSATDPSIMQSTNLVDWVDAEVEWEQNPPAGTKVCYINCGTSPKGFYQAEIRYAGGSKFMTNMQADLMGGIAASNVVQGIVQSIYPTITATGIVWRVMQ